LEGVADLDVAALGSAMAVGVAEPLVQVIQFGKMYSSVEVRCKAPPWLPSLPAKLGHRYFGFGATLCEKSGSRLIEKLVPRINA